MKKIIAFVLAMVLTVSAMSLCISAASNSQTGVYKSKTYRGYVRCSDTTAFASMSWEGTQHDVKVTVEIFFKDRKTGYEGTAGGTSAPQQKFASKEVPVPNGAVAVKGRCTGYIGSVYLVSNLIAYPGR